MPDYVAMSEEEFARLLAEGAVEVGCRECSYLPSETAATAIEQAQTVLEHMMVEHGYTRDEAAEALINVRVEVYSCPRCDVRYKTRDPDLTAVSRADNITNICHACETAEAYQHAATGRVTPVSEWPVQPLRTASKHGFQNPDWSDQRSNRSHRPNPVPAPKEVPDLRLHLLERWVEEGIFDRQANIYAAGAGPDEAAWERLALRNASLWWVKDEMVDLVTAAARTIPSEVKAGEIDLPADQPYGLAVLGKTWVGSDAENPNGQVHVDAVVWGPARVDGTDCFTVSFYRYVDFAGGLTKTDLALAVETGLISEARSERLGEALSDDGTEVGTSYRLFGGAWTWLGRTDWPLKAALTDFDAIPRHPDDTDRRRETMIEDRRWFAALCVLVNHRLSQTEPVYAARQTRRRAERAGVTERAAPSTVRIIRLRQAKHEAGEETGEHRKVDWTHRWMVGSHMAWRRCGPKRSQRRLVFITPFIKGPKDKPLILKDNVRVWIK